jgi:hypothetical protein
MNIHVTFLTSKKSVPGLTTAVRGNLVLAHTLLDDSRATIALKRSLCESGHFRALVLHCEQEDLLSLATNLLRNH